MFGLSTKKLVLVRRIMIFYFKDKCEGNNKKSIKCIVDKFRKELEHFDYSKPVSY